MESDTTTLRPYFAVALLTSTTLLRTNGTFSAGTGVYFHSFHIHITFMHKLPWTDRKQSLRSFCRSAVL